MRFLSLILSLAVLVFPVTGFASVGSGSAAGQENPVNLSAEEILSFSKKVEKSLAEKGARVAIVGRVGRDRDDLPDGVSYTHVAYWVYSDIQTADGRTIPGYHIYNLYQREGERDVSDLINDFPVDYFAGVYELDAGVIIPKPEAQRAILDVISSDTYQDLHNPKYSVVANPFNDEYQNCTEHVLDVLMSAMYKTDDVTQLKANAKAYFLPQTVSLGPLKTLFGPLFVSDFKTRDHDGSIQTATFTTLAEFMKRYDLTQEIYTIKPGD